ncbi:E3 ubiquitin-protein ligase RNF220 [Condylostylus longicornis]|uniref:E3 ubiquitin-protein ligase RNF220 n=1 Tax=Condylostylus longicornis TaxID=2530218 RepID=UPI00244E29C4|nr:E3 ubiquitin-protein ligase RNF220 [Condylostylus longicornis]
MEDIEIDRGLRRKNKSCEVICPVCDVTILPGDIEQHYELEVDRLIKIQINSKLRKTSHVHLNNQEPIAGCSTKSKEDTCLCPWVSFQKIRNNRHSRLKVKNKKRKFGDTVCPVCNEYPNEDINIHVEKCLKNDNKNENENRSDDEEDIDIECENFEEYEWAGQKRVRASSFLEGGYSGAGSFVRNTKEDTCDEELNVDGDDTQLYGPPQYLEKHIIVPFAHENDKESNANMYLRQLVCVQETSLDRVKNGQEQHYELNENLTQIEKENRNNFLDGNICGNSISMNNRAHEQDTTLQAERNSENEKRNVNQIIESLKMKIREYENQTTTKNKCLICMDVYFKPAVSICCWHVHCETCWLRTLGARKLCPQCNMITSPTDLRRIYL